MDDILSSTLTIISYKSGKDIEACNTSIFLLWLNFDCGLHVYRVTC